MKSNVYHIRDYRPGPQSLEFHRLQWNREIKEVIICAAIRSGKSYSMIHEIFSSAWNNRLDGGTLVCAPTYKMLKPILEMPIVGLFETAGMKESYNGSDHILKLRSRSGFPDSSRYVYFRSLEKPDNIRSLTVANSYIDEMAYCSGYAVDVVRGRMLTTSGRLTGCSTPNGFNWFYDAYFSEDAQQRIDPSTAVLRYGIHNNPMIKDEDVERLRARYDPRLAAQELDAEFVAIDSDLVYYAFTNENLVPFQGLDYYKPIIIGLDYNIGKNAWVAAQKISPVDIHIFAEGFGARTTQDVAAQLLSQFGNKHLILIDDASSGKARQQGDGKTNRDIIRQCGIGNVSSHPKNPFVDRRVSVVNAMFENGLREHHLFIDPACKRTVSEFRTLTRRKDGSGKIDDESGKKGHISDAAGYMIMYVTGGDIAVGQIAPSERATWKKPVPRSR